MGLAESMLHRMELGMQNVTLKTLKLICVRLKCGASDVLIETN